MNIGKKTVDSVLAGFTKVLNDLEAVATREYDLSETKKDQVADLNQQITRHECEAARAEKVRVKLSKLIEE